MPAGLSNLTLAFWNKQSLETSSTGCFDGGILESSTDGGTTWTQVTTGLLTDPYNGAVSTQYSNPTQGLQGLVFGRRTAREVRDRHPVARGSEREIPLPHGQ